ncbi:MAG: protein kinase domain-containing protein [Acidobacteriota bacterium]
MRSLDQGAGESGSFGASDTAVAVAESQNLPKLGSLETPVAGTPALTASMATSAELVGATLSGRYLVTRKVGQGGMGAVYEATHTLIGKRVAVKVLLDKYAQREAIVARLKQEAQLASQIGNEHIIDITDFGNTDDGRTFVVMEYLEGESLAECLARESKLPEQRILRIASQSASALAAAHKKGIVHRDIKPENLFLLRRKDQDFVKVVDFGISKSLRSSDEQEELPRLTQTGMVLGTPLYMSPEQARGDEDLDHRVDIYALGVIMYEAACGRVPFAGTNYLSVISQVLNTEPTPLRELRPELSEEFEAIVLRAMAKDRTHRYADANAMLADVTALLEDPTHSTERAKITGPRRLMPRPRIPKAAWAVGGIGVAIGGVTLAVVLLMGGGGKQKQPVKPVVVPVHAPADAAVAVIAVDAPGEPEVKTVELDIETEPAGASVYKEDEAYGKAPVKIPFVLRNKDIAVRAQLAGYDDAVITLNPLEHVKDKTIRLVLKKAKGAPKTIKMTPKPGSGSGSEPANHGNGEVGPNPYKHSR